MPDKPSPLSRRDAIKWLAGTAAGTAAAPMIGAPNETEPAPVYPSLRSPIFDPDYAKPYVPFDKVLTKEELKTITVLADIILPKDDLGPAASEVGVPDFINEWVSAPYDKHRDDCEAVRGGIGWLNTESFRRAGKRFDELKHEQQIGIVDDICDSAKAKIEHKIGATFFKKFRSLSLSGYYTHSATWKQLGYVGNVTIGGSYPGVPKEIIEKLGLQDVA